MADETMIVTSSEAHLDLLLAEELSVNETFMRRFIAPIWALEEDEALTISVRLNVWDEGGDGCSSADAGENDLDVVVTSEGHCLRLLIEDKVWAEFQPDQCSRHHRRAASRGDATFLVAPRTRLADSRHAHCEHVRYAIEDLADWLTEQSGSGADDPVRLRWKAEVLRRLCTPTHREPKPDHPTVAFSGFCASWLAEREIRAKPNTNSLRTPGNGWLRFSEPSGLIYKVIHGRVDLYVADHGFTGTVEDLHTLVSAGRAPEGFVAATDTAGNPVLRYEHRASLCSPQDGVPEDTAGVETALEACAVATTWIAESQASLNLTDGNG